MIALVTGISDAGAATYTWNAGGVTTSYTDADNWTPLPGGTLGPLSADTANIATGTATLDGVTTAAADTVNLTNTGTFSLINASVFSVGTLQIGGQSLVSTDANSSIHVSTAVNLSDIGTISADSHLVGGAGATMAQSGGTMNGIVSGIETYTHSGGKLGGSLTTGTYTLTDAAATSTGGTIIASDNFALDVTSGTAVIDAILYGAADMVKSGTGTVVLANAANDFLGSISIEAGTFQAIDDAIPDYTPIAISSGATLQMSDDAFYIFRNEVNGADGIMIKDGTGSLFATGDIQIGALAINDGALEIGGFATNNTVSFGTANVAAGATLHVIVGSTLTATAASPLVNNGSFENDGTTNTDVDNTGTFSNNSALTGAVSANTGEIDNYGAWTGNIVDNASNATVTNDAGGEWHGDVIVNEGMISSAGIWTGDIQGNANTISNDIGGEWTGDVLSNDGSVSNNGQWTGDVASNAGGINLNEDAHWIGDVDANTGNIGNSGGTWAGNVAGNSGTIINDNRGDETGTGYWIGDILANDNGIYNFGGGNWTGNVVGNGPNGQIFSSELSVWNGDVLGNDGTIESSGTWTGDIVRNDNSINNDAPGAWTGNVLSNDGSVSNSGQWTGDVVSNAGGINLNEDAHWTGNITANAGNIGNSGGTWTGDVAGNSGTIINDNRGDETGTGYWIGDILANDGGIYNFGGGNWTGNVVGNGPNGQIFSSELSVWNGDVLGNDGTIESNGVWAGNVLGNSAAISNAGTWIGNVASNGASIDNLTGGTWTGDILGNADRINNGSGSTWSGDVVTNDGTVYNYGGWRGDILANSSAVDNFGTDAVWTGDISGNDLGQIVNDLGGTWNGDVLGNHGAILNQADSAWNGNVSGNGTSDDNNGQIQNGGAWSGNVEGNFGQIYNIGGHWTGDVTRNSGAGFIFNSDVSDWTGDVLANNGTIQSDGVWTGDVLSNRGAINSHGIWNGSIVSSGSLELGNRVNGAINNSGILTVAGSLSGVTALTNTGTINMQDGSPTQILTVGSVRFGPGSFFDIDINAAGDHDRMVVTGAAALDGAVRVSAATGAVYMPGTTYTILTAGSLSGQFTSVTTDLAFLTPELSQDATRVTLTVTRNQVDFADAGKVRNQRAAGAAVQSLGAGNPVYDALLPLNMEQARLAFDQLSGEGYNSIESAYEFNAGIVADLVGSHMDETFDITETGQSSRAGAASSGHSEGGWVQAYGVQTRLSGKRETAGLKSGTGGIAAGLDGLAGDWRVGVMAFTGTTEIDVPSLYVSSSSTDYGGGVYGGRQWGATRLSLGATYMWHDIDATRSAIFPHFADHLSAGYSARTAQAFGTLSRVFHLGAQSLMPFASLAHVRQDTPAFMETGGPAALYVASNETSATFTTLGLGGERSFLTGAGMPVSVKAKIGWRHAFADAPEVAHSFVTGDAFSIYGAPIAGDAAVLSTSLNMTISANSSLAVKYDGQVGRNAESHALTGTWSMRF